MHRGSADLIYPQPIHQHADADHIRHCIHCPHLMEVDLLHRFSVGAAFRLGDGLVYPQRMLPHRFRQRQMGYHMRHIRHAGMVVAMLVVMVMRMHMRMIVIMRLHRVVMGMHMVMVVVVVMLMLMAVLVVMVMCMFVSMIVAVLLLAVHLHRNMGTQDAALLRFLHGVFHARDSQGIELFQFLLWIRKQLQQRTHEHIPCCAHFAFEIQCFHLSPPMCAIMLAKYPAPNPLSMFTTLVPLAQEFSILSSADNPPKFAP